MRKILIAAAIAASTATVPAVAQVNTGDGLVAVNIQNVDILDNFLNDAQIAALNDVWPSRSRSRSRSALPPTWLQTSSAAVLANAGSGRGSLRCTKRLAGARAERDHPDARTEARQPLSPATSGYAYPGRTDLRPGFCAAVPGQRKSPSPTAPLLWLILTDQRTSRQVPRHGSAKAWDRSPSKRLSPSMSPSSLG